ncbi:MAG: DUF1080 domain-containing protein [Kiritimatiellia bacterium]
MSGNRPLARLLLCCAALAAGAADKPPPGDVLREFTPAAQQRIERHLHDLGDEKSGVRREAQQQLATSPILTSSHLVAALQSDDPEIAQRAGELAGGLVEENEKRLAEALTGIVTDSLKGEAAHLVDAFPACVGNDRLRAGWRRAFLATCATNDAPLLVALLDSPLPPLRESALTAGSRLNLPAVTSRRAAFLRDPDESVRFQTATMLLEEGDRAALPTLIDLLDSPTLSIRSRGHSILRSVTGRDSTFVADDPPERRAGAVAGWREWLAGPGKDAPLTAGKAGPGAVTLATPQELERWIAHTPDTKNVWSIRDGVLVCSGKGNGVLISPEPVMNYTLSYEWRWPGQNGDSGLFLGIEALGADSLRAIEVQMLAGAAGDFWRIGYYPGPDGKPLIPNHVPRAAEVADAAENDWNLMEVTLLNGHLDVLVNGKKVNELDGLPAAPTHFGLQVEGTPFEIRRLRAEPLP